MDQGYRTGGERQPELDGADHTAHAKWLALLRRYSAGEISDREAANLTGGDTTIHDVFAGMVENRLPLPVPDPETLEAELNALRKLYAGRKLNGER